MTRHIESFLWEAFDRVAAIPFFGYGDGENTGHYHYHGRTDDVATVIPDGSRQLAEEEEEDGAGGGGVAVVAGVDDTRISYEDLYASLIFVMCVYASGTLVRRALRMPPLVGEILAGVLLGPNLAGYVPSPASFVMLGELGLLLLLLDAGVTVDLPTLRLVGYRGLLIAIVGSMLPISIAFGVSLAIGADVSGGIAAGACFGPTSAGIAMSALKRAGMLESPVGQLVVCAAVIDDMIALVVLSQLNALVVGDGPPNNGASLIIVPIASALGFLTLGGAIAVRVLPPLLDRYYFSRFGSADSRGTAGVALMFLFLIGMMPATYYAKASYLLGAFLSGLAFCGVDEVRDAYTSQFKRLIQWLMRIFFAASIGFQVPIGDFGDGRVVGIGFLYSLAFAGKFAVGFLSPNFKKGRRFRGSHLRDCLITGCSMVSSVLLPFGTMGVVAIYVCIDVPLAHPRLTYIYYHVGIPLPRLPCWHPTPSFALSLNTHTHTHTQAAEAEFAFIVAVFGRDQNLFSESLYASIIFAIVLSEIFAPFALQCTLSYWDKVDHHQQRQRTGSKEEAVGEVEEQRTDRGMPSSELTNTEDRE